MRFSRWLRLLFTREFNLRQAMILWDGIFAVDTTMQLAYWVCVAMLVRIRNKCNVYVEKVFRMLTYHSDPSRL
jgi:TBC1 domain family protein 5